MKVDLWQKRTAKELLLTMLPQAKASYERISKLRDEIGAMNFDVAKAIRELRNDHEDDTDSGPVIAGLLPYAPMLPCQG